MAVLREQPSRARPRAFAAPPAQDVVVALSFSTFAAGAARGGSFPEDRLVTMLLEHPRVRRLLVCDPPRSLPLRILRDLVDRGAATFPESDRAHLHRPARLRRSDPVSPRAVARGVAAHERSLRKAAARAGLERPAVFADHPLLAGGGRFDWAGPVTYYAWDDWLALDALKRWWPAYERAFAGLRAAGHRVVAVSDAALARVAPTGPSRVVPNGVDPAEWVSLPPAPAWFAALPGPRLLYVGSLQSRLDVQAVRRTAEAWPDGSVVLVGPVDDPAHVATLRSSANVHFQPPVGRTEVAALVGAADACLLPHVRSPLTEAMSPLKLYEYLAGGAPVAAVDLPPVRGIDPRVHLAADTRAFTRAVAAALASGRAREVHRRRFVAHNAWSARHEQILDLALGPA